MLNSFLEEQYKVFVDRFNSTDVNVTQEYVNRFIDYLSIKDSESNENLLMYIISKGEEEELNYIKKLHYYHTTFDADNDIKNKIDDLIKHKDKYGKNLLMHCNFSKIPCSYLPIDNIQFASMLQDKDSESKTVSDYCLDNVVQEKNAFENNNLQEYLKKIVELKKITSKLPPKVKNEGDKSLNFNLIHEAEASNEVMLKVNQESKEKMNPNLNNNSKLIYRHEDEDFIHAVRRYERPQLVEQFLEKGANPNAIDSQTKTVLILAVCNKREEIVEMLLKNGADLNCMDLDGMTALMYAARDGHKEIFELLLNDKNVQLDLKNKKEGNTALMYAAHKGRKEIVEKLLEKGANLNFADSSGKTALIYAISSGSKEIVEMLLLVEGVNLDSVDSRKTTALNYAIWSEYKEVDERLLEKGANPNFVDSSGNTALINSASVGSKEIVEKLLKMEVKLDLRGSSGETALMRAVRGGHKEIVDMLLEKGANLSPVDLCGDDALTHAVRNGQASCL